MAGDDDAAALVARQNAFGSIYGAQFGDAGKSARANEMARRLGLPPDIVEADFPNMAAEDRVQQATARAQSDPRYASMMSDPRFAAAAIDDPHIHPLAGAVQAHQDMQDQRPATGFRSVLTGLLGSAASFATGGLAGLGSHLYNALPSGPRSYLAGGLESGLYQIGALAGDVAESFNPVSAVQRGVQQVKGIGDTLVNGAPGFIRSQTQQARATPFTRFSEDMQRRSQTVDQSPETKQYSDLTYATTDPSKSALLSPVRMAHDVLQSLPTTAALAATVILTRGAAIKGEAEALAQGLEPEIAKQVGIKAAAKMASWSGAAGEGVIGGIQQNVQTRTQILDEKPADLEQSPMYKMLVKSGIDKDAARQYLATQTGAMAGIDAGAVDAVTNLAEGPILGRIIGEGGGIASRAAKGFLTEATTEGIQSAGEQVGQNAAVQHYADPHQKLTDGVVESVLQGFVVGGLTGGGFAAALGHSGEAAHATAAAANVDRVMNAAGKSSTRSANPSDFERVLHQQLEGRPGENLYIPADKVSELFQDSPISEDAFWSRYSDQIDQAHDIGGDVVIPLSEAATHLAGSPQWQQLREHVRATPGGMSLAEAKSPQSEAELEAAANGLAEHIDKAAPQIEAARVVKDFVGKLLPAGEQADKAAQLLGANLAVQTTNENAKRAARGEAPITPAEMFKKWNLRAGDQAPGPELIVARDVPPSAPVQRVKQPKRPGKPQTVVAFVRARGGIKNDEGHLLTSGAVKSRDKNGRVTSRHPGGRGLNRHPGLINNKTGMSIDAIGELLHEAGYFGPPSETPRPTTDDVLQLLEKNDGKAIVPEAMAEAAQQAREADTGEEQAVRDEIEEVAKSYTTAWTPADTEAAMYYRADGMTADEAIVAVMRDVSTQTLDELDGESESGYDYKSAADDNFDETFYQSDGGSPSSRSAGPNGQQGTPGASEGGTSQRPEGEQKDAFGNRPGDTKAWLERLGEGRLKPTKAQKAPGSDGGLFDTRDTQSTLFQVTPEQARATNVPVEMPTDPLFAEAVANTKTASITRDGLLIDVVRVQKTEQEGDRSIRTGVFYLPKGSPNLRHYKTGGQPGSWYGGSEKFEGETLIRRPLFVKGATGGKAPQVAYDAIKGKGAYAKLEREVIGAAVNPALKSRDDGLFEENIYNVLEAHGADRNMAWDIIRNSKQGNQLRYALQENIIAHAVRDAGYDAVVGYSKGKLGASISEVFDVREQTYPAHGVDSEIHNSFIGQGLNQGARGSISLTHDANGNMSGAVIRAFDSANFSTFVHEMGHFWLEDLKLRASSADATPEEKADWKTVQDWMFDNGHDASQNIPTDAHEMWARGMERYVFEGSAPSRSLKALFARMRDWMLELYRTALAFNSPITSQIRDVMDRMFASDREIEQVRADLVLASSHIEGLMTDAELAAYHKLGDDARSDARDELYKRVLSVIKREKNEEASARTKEIRAAVTEEVDNQPIFTALKILRSGVYDGQGGTNRARLSKRWLVDNYGEGILDRIPNKGIPIAADTDTIDAEHLAEEAGFDSADQMVNALVEHEAQRQRAKQGGEKRSMREAAIENETERRVRDEIGDPMANIEEEAQGVLSSTRQTELMSMELRALARKTAQKVTPWQMATEWAKRHIAGSKVRDSITGAALQSYARNAGKAGRQAEEALIKGIFEDAFRYKQQQMLNLALLSEGKKAKDAVAKAVARLQGIGLKKTIKSVDQDYLDQAHQLLEGVDLKTRPLSQVDKRASFEAWYAGQVAKGIEPIVPPEYQRILGTSNYQNLTNDELLELDDIVGQIMKLGRLKQQLLDNGKARDFNEAVEEMQASAEEGRQRKRTAANDPSRVLSAKAASIIRSGDSALIKLETIIDWLDNGNPNGPWNRMIFRVLSDAQGKEADLTREYAKEINEHIKAVPREQARRWARWVDTPELINNIPGHPERGTPMKFGMDQIVMMAMNWGNEGSRQRLVDGFGWDEATVKHTMDRLLTKEDWDFVQNIWDTVDKLWPAMSEMERRVNGVAPPKVEAVEVPTSHGTYKGGYFPAVYDPTYSTTAQLQEQDKLSPNGAFFKATTRAGSTRERVAAVKGRPLLLNLGVITRHMSEVIHDITHREAINQVTKILTSRRIRTAVDNALGPEYLKTMERVVDNIARPGSANSKSHPATVAIARYLNKGISIVGMGLRVSTILQQPLGLANLAGMVGERAVGEGLAISIAHPVKTYNEVTERSAEMRHRFSNMDATIHAMWEEHQAGKLALMGPGAIEKASFQGIAYADALITTGGWIGSYNKGLREGMSEDDAVYYADKMIRASQGAGGAKDQAPIQFDHALMRAFVPFFSYLNANYNQRRDAYHKARRGEAGAAIRQYWWVAVVPSLMMAMLFGQGSDDDTPEGWAEYLMIQQILGGVSTIPGIGPIANALGNGYGYRVSPWQQAGDTAVKVARDVKAATDGNDDTHVSKSWIKNALYVAGVVTHKPLGQIGATAQGIHDYATGDADPQSAGDWYNLMTTGRIPQPKN